MAVESLDAAPDTAEQDTPTGQRGNLSGSSWRVIRRKTAKELHEDLRSLPHPQIYTHAHARAHAHTHTHTHTHTEIIHLGFPGGAVVEGPPANAGVAGSSPGPGGSHMPRSSWARAPRPLSLRSGGHEPQLLSPRSRRAGFSHNC